MQGENQWKRDVVVFRKWKDGFGVIALFPEIPTDLYGRYCESYEHIGQHGGADYFGVIMNTRPANTVESADLAEELRIIGYDLRQIKKPPNFTTSVVVDWHGTLHWLTPTDYL